MLYAIWHFKGPWYNEDVSHFKNNNASTFAPSSTNDFSWDFIWRLFHDTQPDWPLDGQLHFKRIPALRRNYVAYL